MFGNTILKVRAGFSLIEVVFAIGIFLVTILALVGLLGPTLKSVDKVEEIDEITSVVNTLNAFLQSSPDIADRSAALPTTKFDEIYNAVQNDGYATVFFFRRFTGPTDTTQDIGIGFDGETNAVLDSSDFDNLAGPVYRIVLSASSVTPPDHRSAARDSSTGIYTLAGDLASYDEGYFALEARIFRIETDTTVSAGGTGAVPVDPGLAGLNDIEPIFTYNTAVVR
ncbi:MAG: type II secretion system protein [Verrucomicrobiota bacterium]